MVTLQQAVNGRYLDAYGSEAKGFAATTVAAGYVAESFKWVLTPVPGGEADEYTLVQKATGRHLDAYTTEQKGHACVTVAAGYVAESFKWKLTRLDAPPVRPAAAAASMMSYASSHVSSSARPLQLLYHI